MFIVRENSEVFYFVSIQAKSKVPKWRRETQRNIKEYKEET
jgi:hypothetical protein